MRLAYWGGPLGVPVVLSGHFFRLGVDGELGEVLAETYHPTEHALYLVDQLSQAPAKSKGGGVSTLARLLRVDVFSGALQQLGSWLRFGVVHDRHFLVVDRDGALLLVATSALAGKHVVVRLSTFAGQDAIGVTCEEVFATVSVVPAPGNGVVYSVARVRLDSLGPGIAPD